MVLSTISVKTETVPDDQKNSFGYMLPTDNVATDVATIQNTFNGTVKKFVVRRTILEPRLLRSEQIFSADAKPYFNSELDHSIMENFLKLLYGFTISTNVDELYNIWLYSKQTSYVNANELFSLLELNIKHLSSDKQFEILMLSKNKRKIVADIGLNSLKKLNIDHRESLSRELYQMFFETTIEKYKVDTSSQKEEIKKLNAELKQLKQPKQNNQDKQVPKTSVSDTTNSVLNGDLFAMLDKLRKSEYANKY